MKPTEFGELVKRFSARPTIVPAGGRHMYLWHGEALTLDTHLPHDNVARLDLHQLTRTLEQKPTDRDAARRVLERAIQDWLRDPRARDGVQQIITVSGCDLLMRYRLSMGTFFQAVGDSLMVILIAPPYPAPSRPLPRYVDFKPSATFDYLKSLLSDSVIVE